MHACMHAYIYIYIYIYIYLYIYITYNIYIYTYIYISSNVPSKFFISRLVIAPPFLPRPLPFTTRESPGKGKRI